MTQDSSQPPVSAVAPPTTSIPETAQSLCKGQFFEIYQWPQQLYDGSVATFERVKRPDTAGVLAITPDHKILVTEQEQPLHPPFWGLLGGVVDPGESPLEAAQRELLEESGYRADRWQKWFAVQPSQRIIWTIHTYIAYGVKLIQPPQPEAGEKITIHQLEFEQFLELVQQDTFRDQEVALQVLKAMVKPAALLQLRQLFFEEAT